VDFLRFPTILHCFLLAHISSDSIPGFFNFGALCWKKQNSCANSTKGFFCNKSAKPSDFEGKKLQLNTFRRRVPAGTSTELARIPKKFYLPLWPSKRGLILTVDNGQSTHLTKLAQKKTLVHTCQTQVWSLKLCRPILWSVLGFWKFSEWKDLHFQGFLTFQNTLTSASEFSKTFQGISGFCEGTSKELAVQVGSLRSSSIS